MPDIFKDPFSVRTLIRFRSLTSHQFIIVILILAQNFSAVTLLLVVNNVKPKRQLKNLVLVLVVWGRLYILVKRKFALILQLRYAPLVPQIYQNNFAKQSEMENMVF